MLDRREVIIGTAATILVPSMGSTETVQWQPIETAPKDGTVILLYEPNRYAYNIGVKGGLIEIEFGRWHDRVIFEYGKKITDLKSWVSEWRHAFVNGRAVSAMRPTHWMLPPSSDDVRWQPINTLNKNENTVVLLYAPPTTDRKHCVYTGAWMAVGWLHVDFVCNIKPAEHAVTHWMNLPEPPQA